MKTIALLIFLSVAAHAGPLATVSLNQFPVGRKWTWAYSELDSRTKTWKAPYFYETYTVIAVAGSKVTVEMSSGPVFPVTSAAHHKFVADVNKCLSASADPKRRILWTMAFYTKSFGPEWELVSSAFKPAAFVEKFNCIGVPRPNEKFASEYFQEPGPLAGVAKFKDFKNGYKFEYLAP